MRTVIVEKRGGIDALQLVEREKPEPTPDQILIRTEYAGLNYADVMQREGRYPNVLPTPYVPGSEVAGVVDAVGTGVAGFEVGDRVAAVMLEGGYAEYVVVSPFQAFRIPDEVDSAAATSLLVQGFTAYLLVKEGVREGDEVLVTAAAGGVGSIAIQLAKLFGAARVVGGASARAKLELIEELGAEPVCYGEPGWLEGPRSDVATPGFDTIIDSVGGEVREACYRRLAPFGRMIIYGNSSQGEERWDAARWHALLMANQSVHGFAVTHWMAAHPGFAQEAFAYLADAAARGRLSLPVHPAYALEDVQQAHLDLDGRRTTGKVVLKAAGGHS